MTGRPSRERLSSQVVLLLEDYGNRQIDPRTRLCMHPCVFVGVCQANVAAAAAMLHPTVFYCNRNPQKCPGYPLAISYRRRTSKGKTLQDFFFLSVKLTVFFWLDRFVDWLLCVCVSVCQGWTTRGCYFRWKIDYIVPLGLLTF